ncbi:Polyketide cyclase/dehydrase and lipid transport superfamily protein [Forsythia ovata]|uniref:Polyketide cyclase/dehydrase and lipid transport superfamily protein n=1 Tax=Forsythia ovata TaxID=205694 RepID=A0ABD1VGE5_9LAMI
MSNKVVEVTASIESTPDRFYTFFRYQSNNLTNVFPQNFLSVQNVEGEDGEVGCVKLWNYVLGGIPREIKLKVEAINDAERSITYHALDGDVINFYPVFKFTIAFGNGVARWTFVYRKVTPAVPTPVNYGTVFSIDATEVVDLYLLNH